jgi:hypothetical protein
VNALEVAASSCSLCGALLLTWPALRAGRVLNRAAHMAKGAERASDPVSANIFRRFQEAFAHDTWRPSDQRLLWAGLIVTLLGGALDMYYRLSAR